jgi:hypothetical protein
MTTFDNRRSVMVEPQLVEVLKEEGQISYRIQELVQQASKSLRISIKAPFVRGDGAYDQLIDIAIDRGLSCSVLVENSALQDPGIVAWIHKLQDSGNQVRFLKNVPIRLSIFDGHRALLALPNQGADHSTSIGVMLTQSNAIDFLGFAFDQLWVKATKISAFDSPK